MVNVAPYSSDLLLLNAYLDSRDSFLPEYKGRYAKVSDSGHRITLCHEPLSICSGEICFRIGEEFKCRLAHLPGSPDSASCVDTGVQTDPPMTSNPIDVIFNYLKF